MARLPIIQTFGICKVYGMGDIQVVALDGIDVVNAAVLLSRLAPFRRRRWGRWRR